MFAISTGIDPVNRFPRRELFGTLRNMLLASFYKTIMKKIK